MRVAVVEGTGLVGRHTCRALQQAGHDAVVVARSTGADIVTGAGLDAALDGVEAVIDVTNTAAADATAAREELALAGPIPATVVRATQFHEFAAMVVGWTRQGDVATVPPLLVQPAAASDVGQVLMEVATGAAHGGTLDLAGPETQDLIDMARRTMAARGESVRLVPTWRSGVFSVEMAGEVLLPSPDARLAPTTFDTWLATEAASAA